MSSSHSLRDAWPAREHDMQGYVVNHQGFAVGVCTCTGAFFGATLEQAKERWVTHVHKMYLEWRDRSGIDA